MDNLLTKLGKKVRGKNFLVKTTIIDKKKIIKGGGKEDESYIYIRAGLISKLHDSLLYGDSPLPEKKFINEKIGNKTILMEIIDNWHSLIKYTTEDGLINLIKKILNNYKPDLNIVNNFGENVLILAIKNNLGNIAKIFDDYQEDWKIIECCEDYIKFAVLNDCINFVNKILVKGLTNNIILYSKSKDMFFTLMTKDASIDIRDNKGKDVLMCLIEHFKLDKPIKMGKVKYGSYILLKDGFDDYFNYCHKNIKDKKSLEFLSIIEFLYRDNYNFNCISKHKECILHKIDHIHPLIKTLLIALYSGEDVVSYDGYTWLIKLLLNKDWSYYKPLIAQYDFKYPINLLQDQDYNILDYIINNESKKKYFIKAVKDAIITICYKYAKYSKAEIRSFLNKQSKANTKKILDLNGSNIEYFAKNNLMKCYITCYKKILDNMPS